MRMDCSLLYIRCADISHSNGAYSPDNNNAAVKM